MTRTVHPLLLTITLRRPRYTDARHLHARITRGKRRVAGAVLSVWGASNTTPRAWLVMVEEFLRPLAAQWLEEAGARATKHETADTIIARVFHAFETVHRNSSTTLVYPLTFKVLP